MGNLTSRADTYQGYTEQFCGVYPPAALCAVRGNALNRLTNSAMGAQSEKFVAGSTVTWHDYIYAAGNLVAERFCSGAAPCGTGARMRYAVSDHLGSPSSLTDETGAPAERLSYDAWGARRNANGTDALCGAIASATTRGFTGHEMLDAVCLVNANARLYDPAIGRFLSADSIVPDPLNGQSFNRYAYVLGNPLRYIDPSGHDSCGSSVDENGFLVDCVLVQADRGGEAALAAGLRNDPGGGGGERGDGIEQVVVTAPKLPPPKVMPVPIVPIVFSFGPSAPPDPFGSAADRLTNDPNSKDQCNKVNQAENARGQRMANTGRNAVRAGGVVALFTPVDPAAGAAGGIMAVGGLFLIGGGMFLMEDAGNNRGAFETGTEVAISEGVGRAGGNPDITAAAPKDPAALTAQAITEMIAGPDGCP